MFPFGYGVPGAYAGAGWSWWAIVFLIAFAAFFLVCFCWLPYR